MVLCGWAAVVWGIASWICPKYTTKYRPSLALLATHTLTKVKDPNKGDSPNSAQIQTCTNNATTVCVNTDCVSWLQGSSVPQADQQERPQVSGQVNEHQETQNNNNTWHHNCYLKTLHYVLVALAGHSGIGNSSLCKMHGRKHCNLMGRFLATPENTHDTQVILWKHTSRDIKLTSGVSV